MEEIVFGDVISYMHSYCIRVALNPMTDTLIKKGDLETHRHPQREEGQVKVESEIVQMPF